MTASEFYTLNKINGNYNLKAGETLKVYDKKSTQTSSNNANASPKNTTTSSPSNNTINYKVKAGDTLSAIALKYEMELIDLYSLNNINNKYILKAGDTIKVEKVDKTRKKITVSYTVVSGDNLYVVAKKHEMTFNELINLNKIKSPNSYTLKIGQKLNVHKTIIVVNNSSNEKQEDTLPKASFIWPYRGSISSHYGVKNDKTANRGISMTAKKGDKIVASDDGIIEYASNIRGFGTVVIIKHENDYTSSYAHLEKSEVKVGDVIKKGDKVGYVGDTGFIDEYELYFRISYKGKPINPMLVLPKG